MTNVLYDKDTSLDPIKEKVVAVIGYGAQGRAQALNLRDSGINVIIGARKDGKSFEVAEEEGFDVYDIANATKKADIIHILLPDEIHGKIYSEHIKNNVTKNKTISVCHGFSIVYKQIIPPENVDVILVAPKGPGVQVRSEYEAGSGLPGLVAIKQNVSGNAKDTALALAKALGYTRRGVLECTFEQETYLDLFGEQTVLCGGIVYLMKAAFETLMDAGYPEELAYFECIGEAKLLVDLIYNKGFAGMADVISNTAEYGMWTVGPKLVTDETKKQMKETLTRIENGDFAKDWIKEYQDKMPLMKKRREEISKHKMEGTASKVRKLFYS